MSDLSHPLAISHPNPNQQVQNAFGVTAPRTDDPAWQPPTDPATDPEISSKATVINREIPIVTVQTGWTILQVRAAIENLVVGLFDMPAQLVDSISGDSRVHSAFQQRIGGLQGRAVKHEIPRRYRDNETAKKCHRAWVRHWPQMATESVMSDMSRWGFGLGFWVGQMTWDTTSKIWKPYLIPWHARYTYYHWIFRKYVAVTLDGQVPITPGDGHWVFHAPFGQYRGWMYGAIRAIAPWWLARNYALRDWARYSERHGMPIGKAISPMGADPVMVNKFRNDLNNLGQESIIAVPQSANEEFGKFDFDWIETKDQAWDGFQGLISQCNAEITLAVLGQNLTSEVKEGSLAAARVHADVRQAILEADARALSHTIYTQIARPFAAINYGNPDFAPLTSWDIIPYEDNKVNADTFVAFTSAVKMLKDSGKHVNNIVDLARKFGIVLKDDDIIDELSDKSEIKDIHIKAGIPTRNEVRESIGLAPAEDETGDEYTGIIKAPPAAETEEEPNEDDGDVGEDK